MKVFIEYVSDISGKSKFINRLIPALGKLGVTIHSSPIGCDVALGLNRWKSKIRIPKVLRIDNIKKSKYRNDLMRRSVKKSDAVIFQSEYAKKLVFKKLKIVPNKYYVIHNGDDPNEYKDIIDINDEVRKRGSELQGLVSKLNNLEDEYVQKNTQLSNEYQAKRKVYDQLAKEISIVEEDLEITEYGVYKPHFDFDTSEEYKNTLNNVRKAQKQLIKEKKAIVCQTEWQV